LTMNTIIFLKREILDAVRIDISKLEEILPLIYSEVPPK
jgi:hypothetical protein